MGPQHRVLAQIDRHRLRRAIRAERDGDVDRGAEVLLRDFDRTGFRSEAAGDHLARVLADSDLRHGEAVGPLDRHVGPIIILVQVDGERVGGRAQSARRGGAGLALDLDDQRGHLGLGRFDDVDLVGRRRLGATLGAARQGENRGQERREEVAYHVPTPLRRSYWPVIFVSRIAHDRHRLIHQTRLVEKV